MARIQEFQVVEGLQIQSCNSPIFLPLGVTIMVATEAWRRKEYFPVTELNVPSEGHNSNPSQFLGSATSLSVPLILLR